MIFEHIDLPKTEAPVKRVLMSNHSNIIIQDQNNQILYFKKTDDNALNLIKKLELLNSDVIFIELSPVEIGQYILILYISQEMSIYDLEGESTQPIFSANFKDYDFGLITKFWFFLAPNNTCKLYTLSQAGNLLELFSDDQPQDIKIVQRLENQNISDFEVIGVDNFVFVTQNSLIEYKRAAIKQEISFEKQSNNREIFFNRFSQQPLLAVVTDKTLLQIYDINEEFKLIYEQILESSLYRFQWLLGGYSCQLILFNKKLENFIITRLECNYEDTQDWRIVQLNQIQINIYRLYFQQSNQMQLSETDQLQLFFSNQLEQSDSKAFNNSFWKTLQRSSSSKQLNSSLKKENANSENLNLRNQNYLIDINSSGKQIKRGGNSPNSFEKKIKNSDFTFKKTQILEQNSMKELDQSQYNTEDIQSFDMLDGFFDHVAMNNKNKQQKNVLETQTFSSGFIRQEFQLSKQSDFNFDPAIINQNYSLKLQSEKKSQLNQIDKNDDNFDSVSQKNIFKYNDEQVEFLYQDLFKDIQTQNFYLNEQLKTNHQKLLLSQNESKYTSSIYKLDENNSIYFDYLNSFQESLLSLQNPQIQIIDSSQSKYCAIDEVIEQQFQESKILSSKVKLSH